MVPKATSALRNRGGPQHSDARLSKKKLRQRKQRAILQDLKPPKQAETKPQRSLGKAAFATLAVFASVAAGVGYSKYKTTPTPTASKSPNPPDRATKTVNVFSELRRDADIERARFVDDVHAKYSDIGGARHAPMGDCIESLIKTNPGTDGSIERTHDFFQIFDDARLKAEGRADAAGSEVPTVKLLPGLFKVDRGLNVRYLNAQERADCLVTGNADGAMVDPKGRVLQPGKYILVIDQDNNIYATPEYAKYAVHHSSFTGGSPVNFSGEMVVGANGKPEIINNLSGHYLPPKESFYKQLEAFYAAGIDDTKMKRKFAPPRA